MDESTHPISTVEQFWYDRWAGLVARLRYLYWRRRLSGHPKRFTVNGKLYVVNPHNVHVGEYVAFNEGVYINGRDHVHIGDHVHLSPFVRINTGARKNDSHESAPVRIGSRAWLATGVIVNPGVTIGEGAVVGAGSVVMSDLPAHTLSLGFPARPVKPAGD